MIQIPCTFGGVSRTLCQDGRVDVEIFLRDRFPRLERTGIEIAARRPEVGGRVDVLEGVFS